MEWFPAARTDSVTRHVIRLIVIPHISGRHSREMLNKLSAPLFEPNTLSEKTPF